MGTSLLIAFGSLLIGFYLGMTVMALVQINRHRVEEDKPRSPLDTGWTYPSDDVRERYEAECG